MNTKFKVDLSPINKIKSISAKDVKIPGVDIDSIKNGDFSSIQKKLLGNKDGPKEILNGLNFNKIPDNAKSEIQSMLPNNFSSLKSVGDFKNINIKDVLKNINLKKPKIPEKLPNIKDSINIDELKGKAVNSWQKFNKSFKEINNSDLENSTIATKLRDELDTRINDAKNKVSFIKEFIENRNDAVGFFKNKIAESFGSDFISKMESTMNLKDNLTGGIYNGKR